MKILYVCSDPSITPGSRGGGFTTHMEETIHSLKKLGHEVVVLDTKALGPGGTGGAGVTGAAAQGPARLRRAGDSRPAGRAPAPSRARRVPRPLRVLARDTIYCLHNLRFHRVLDALLRQRSDFDFVYVRHTSYQFATSCLAKKWRIPLILEFNASIDERNLNDGVGLRPVAAAIEKLVASRADAVLTVSGVLKQYLEGKGVPGVKIHVLHNAASLEKFSPQVGGRRVRSRFGFSDEDVVVGFVGGFSVWHGAHLLLDAAPLALEKNKHIRFLMVGGREGHPRFEDFKRGALERGLAEAFRFSGEVPRERVPEHIAATDVCVIPWATEYGSPTKTFEYMAMGKALVAPAVAALKEVLEHGKSALFVETGNVAQIAEALVTLASDPGLRLALGNNARDLVERKHNWDKNASEIVEIAREVIAARSAACGTGPRK
ncbi:MAG: glycosyltransferase family 4 protein [Candidatus Eisenbacteria bacterium]|nr:glycosyltransferase family 4 protein [Candidatus Eisenbacteria bacterium]